MKTYLIVPHQSSPKLVKVDARTSEGKALLRDQHTYFTTKTDLKRHLEHRGHQWDKLEKFIRANWSIDLGYCDEYR